MGVVFRHTVEGFLEYVVRPRGLFSHDELVAMQCEPVRELELDAWVALLRATAKRLCPDRSDVDAIEAVGRRPDRRRRYLRPCASRRAPAGAKGADPHEAKSACR